MNEKKSNLKYKVLLNCLLMLTASGFAWSVLSQHHEFTSKMPRLISAIGFIIFFLVISLLPLCCKVTTEERDLPLHDQMGNVQTDSSPPADSSSSSLFKKPPGILRSTHCNGGAETSWGPFSLSGPVARACFAWSVGASIWRPLPPPSFPLSPCSAATLSPGQVFALTCLQISCYLLSLVRSSLIPISCLQISVSDPKPVSGHLLLLVAASGFQVPGFKIGKLFTAGINKKHALIKSPIGVSFHQILHLQKLF